MNGVINYKKLMACYVCTDRWMQFYKNANGYYFSGAKKYYQTLKGAKIAAFKR